MTTRSTMRITAFSLLLFWVRAAALAAEDPRPPVRLTIVGTSDFHGALEPRRAVGLDGRKVGGIDIIQSYFEAIRNANPGGVILLDAGDLYQGTLLSAATEGRAVIDFYNRAGYDAVAVGNHEFDFGPIGPHSVPRNGREDPLGAFKARIRQARFPFLSANITQRRPCVQPGESWISPFAIVERQGVKIGVIGLTTPETPEATYRQNVTSLRFEPMLGALRRALAETRKRGAAVTVVLAHAGVGVDETSGRPMGPIAELAHALRPGEVDLIISGHMHQPFSDFIHGTAVLQPWPHGTAFVRADLVVDPDSGTLADRPRLYGNTFFLGSSVDGRPVHYAGRGIHPVEECSRLIDRARRSVAALQQMRLGLAVEDLAHDGRRDSAVGNLVTDAMRAADPEIDVAMYNSGGLRTSIPRGDITFGRVFEVMPFDSYLMKVSLTGAQIRDVLEHGLASDHGVMQISGLRVVFDPDAPVNRRCVSIVDERGRPLQDEKLYVVGTNDFVLGGGDGYHTFVRGRNVRTSESTIRQLVTSHIEKSESIRSTPHVRYLRTTATAQRAPHSADDTLTTRVRAGRVLSIVQ